MELSLPQGTVLFYFDLRLLISLLWFHAHGRKGKWCWDSQRESFFLGYLSLGFCLFVFVYCCIFFLPQCVPVGSLNLDVKDKGYKRLALHPSVIGGPHGLLLTSSMPVDPGQGLEKSLQGTEWGFYALYQKLPLDLCKLESLSEKEWNSQGSAWSTSPCWPQRTGKP